MLSVFLNPDSRALAQDDDSSARAVTEQVDDAPWLSSLNEAFPQIDGAYEIRRFDLFVLLVRERFVDVLMSIDPELRQAAEELGGQPYGLEKKRTAVGKTHPGIKYLQKFRTTLSAAELTLPRGNNEDRDIEYVKGTFVLWPRHDDSNLSADMLALGIIAEEDPGNTDAGAALTVGSWRRFKCWFERAEQPGEAYHRCGVSLPDLPRSIKERAETDFGMSLHARLRWRGFPRRARAKTVLIRGIGYETRAVLVIDHPRVEFLDADQKVLWRAE